MSISTDTQCVINNKNIICYYPFDNDMLDYQSGIGEKNAIISNVSISTDSTKLNNGSARFPGNNIQNFKLPTISFGKEGITIAVWMKCPVIPKNWMRICDFGNKYDNPSSSLIIGFLPTKVSKTGTPFVGIKTNSIGKDGNFPLNYNISDTNWHHYAFSIQSSGVFSFYVDGVAKPSNNIQFYPSLEPMLSSFLGKSNWVGNENINCYMNQFVMFNRPLSSIEIGYLASNPLNVSFSSKESGIYTIGSSPTITNIATSDSTFIINFAPGKMGSHAVSTYYYSLDGGNTYRDANTTISPITIHGILPDTYYQVTLIAASGAGNTVPSNTVTGFISSETTYPLSDVGKRVHMMANSIKESNKETFQSYDSVFSSNSNINNNPSTKNSIYDYYTFRPKFT